jgi:hypothetical protein
MTIGDGGAAWKRTGWYVVPKTASEVMQVLGRIGVYSRGQQFAWRGMASADYDVASSLHRKLGIQAAEEDVRTAEVEILGRARSWGLGVGESGHADDLQLLADLQHYGVPTRLIDFTSNPMTALWFACQTAPERDDEGRRLAKTGVLLALNVTKWVRHSSVGDPYKLTYGELEQGRRWTLSNALSTEVPFLVVQSVQNARLRAQEGFFVTSAVPDRSGLARQFQRPFVSLDVPFGKVDPSELHERLTMDRRRGNPPPLPFAAVLIGAGLKNKLLEYLGGSYNRRASTLFPDYEGFKSYGLPALSKAQLRAPRNVAEQALDSGAQ